MRPKPPTSRVLRKRLDSRGLEKSVLVKLLAPILDVTIVRSNGI